MYRTRFILITYFIIQLTYNSWSNILGSKEVKGLVHPKMKILSLITHPHVVPKPLDTPFIFGTQIKIFLMESERFLILHRQQGSLHDQGPET